VRGRRVLYRLELKDYFVLDDDIGAESFVEQDVQILDRYRNLAFDAKPSLVLLVRKGDFVNRLQQARAERATHSNRGIDDIRPALVLFHPLRLGAFARVSLRQVSIR